MKKPALFYVYKSLDRPVESVQDLVNRILDVSQAVLRSQGENSDLSALGVRGDFTMGGGASIFLGQVSVVSLDVSTDTQGRWALRVTAHGSDGGRVLAAIDAGGVGCGLLRKS